MRRRQLPGEPPPPTKTELKRRAQEFQDLADRLIGVPAETLAGLALPEKLNDALALARRITSHGAKLRQRLFVAKLLRDVDPEPIRAALALDAEAARIQAAKFRRAERWRDRLVAGEAAAILDFMAEFPQTTRQDLERLARAAIAERRTGKPVGAGRALFIWVRQTLARTHL